MSEYKNFIDPLNHINLAKAIVNEGYIIGGALTEGFQSERVPFVVVTHAINQEKEISIFILSEEKYITYKNKFLMNVASGLKDAIPTSFRDFIEPINYLNQFAASIFGPNLTSIAKSDMPSYFGRNINKCYEELMKEYNIYFEQDRQLGTPTKANNILCYAPLIKYRGFKDNKEYVVLAGMDYEGIEMYTEPLNPLAAPHFLYSIFDKSNKEENSKEFGHGHPCDMMEWGAKARYLLIAPKEYEEKATNDFVRLVSTYQMDDNLQKRYFELKAERYMMRVEEAMQYRAMANQATANLQYQQAKLTQMLQDNANTISAGIMDSWDKKMASSSYISNQFSEAIRGVDTYQKLDGSNVEVGVINDHVYENQYDEVYGVSGNELDNDLLSKLNWTEINKK